MLKTDRTFCHIGRFFNIKCILVTFIACVGITCFLLTTFIGSYMKYSTIKKVGQRCNNNWIEKQFNRFGTCSSNLICDSPIGETTGVCTTYESRHLGDSCWSSSKLCQKAFQCSVKLSFWSSKIQDIAQQLRQMSQNHDSFTFLPSQLLLDESKKMSFNNDKQEIHSLIHPLKNDLNNLKHTNSISLQDKQQYSQSSIQPYGSLEMKRQLHMEKLSYMESDTMPWSLIPIVPPIFLSSTSVKCWTTQLWEAASFFDKKELFILNQINMTSITESQWATATCQQSPIDDQFLTFNDETKKNKQIDCSLIHPKIKKNKALLTTSSCLPWETLQTLPILRRNTYGIYIKEMYSKCQRTIETPCWTDADCSPINDVLGTIKRQCNIQIGKCTWMNNETCLTEFYAFQSIWENLKHNTNNYTLNNENVISHFKNVTANLACCLNSLSREVNDFIKGLSRAIQPEILKIPSSSVDTSGILEMCKGRQYDNQGWWIVTQSGGSYRSYNFYQDIKHINDSLSEKNDTINHLSADHYNGTHNLVLNHNLIFQFIPIIGKNGTSFPNQLSQLFTLNEFKKQSQFILQTIIGRALHLPINQIHIGRMMLFDQFGHQINMHHTNDYKIQIDWNFFFGTQGYLIFPIQIHHSQSSILDFSKNKYLETQLLMSFNSYIETLYLLSFTHLSVKRQLLADVITNIRLVGVIEGWNSKSTSLWLQSQSFQSDLLNNNNATERVNQDTHNNQYQHIHTGISFPDVYSNEYNSELIHLQQTTSRFAFKRRVTYLAPDLIHNQMMTGIQNKTVAYIASHIPNEFHPIPIDNALEEICGDQRSFIRVEIIKKTNHLILQSQHVDDNESVWTTFNMLMTTQGQEIQLNDMLLQTDSLTEDQLFNMTDSNMYHLLQFREQLFQSFEQILPKDIIQHDLVLKQIIMTIDQCFIYIEVWPTRLREPDSVWISQTISTILLNEFNTTTSFLWNQQLFNQLELLSIQETHYPLILSPVLDSFDPCLIEVTFFAETPPEYEEIFRAMGTALRWIVASLTNNPLIHFQLLDAVSFDSNDTSISTQQKQIKLLFSTCSNNQMTSFKNDIIQSFQQWVQTEMHYVNIMTLHSTLIPKGTTSQQLRWKKGAVRDLTRLFGNPQLIQMSQNMSLHQWAHLKNEHLPIYSKYTKNTETIQHIQLIVPMRLETILKHISEHAFENIIVSSIATSGQVSKERVIITDIEAIHWEEDLSHPSLFEQSLFMNTTMPSTLEFNRHEQMTSTRILLSILPRLGYSSLSLEPMNLPSHIAATILQRQLNANSFLTMESKEKKNRLFISPSQFSPSIYDISELRQFMSPDINLIDDTEFVRRHDTHHLHNINNAMYNRHF